MWPGDNSFSPIPRAGMQAVLQVPTKYGPNRVPQQLVVPLCNGGQQAQSYLSVVTITSYWYLPEGVTLEQYFGSSGPEEEAATLRA